MTVVRHTALPHRDHGQHRHHLFCDHSGCLWKALRGMFKRSMLSSTLTDHGTHLIISGQVAEDTDLLRTATPEIKECRGAELFLWAPPCCRCTTNLVRLPVMKSDEVPNWS
ncbi:hypothetical protein SKAU_G00213880 [Synaphobranchus kaupii]|uniref:Uncharacterized protein n=1 Tax=Synaphobranchus kaupii TaxID=118154 RepID=A0A9Q1IV74_SYNKA|nr:hypothetical protein SKAU_G00213880 [Synaphobranchus kaupii]